MRALIPRAVASDTSSSLAIAPVAVACGFPSPAHDYYDGPIDLTEMLIEDQAATFIVRAAGASMVGAGITNGDEPLIDRSLKPRSGDVVVAALDGELTLKRLDVTPHGLLLRAENAAHPDITVSELSELDI